MVVGTFLFFWSVAGFAVAILTRTKSPYFKGIRMFTVRQISGKINTAFASTAVVSIMLFFALTIASTGMGLVQLFVDNLENTTAYDATIMANAASAFETSATGDSAAVGNSRRFGALPKIARARLRSAHNLRIAENPDRYILSCAPCLGNMPYDTLDDGIGKHAFRRTGRGSYRFDRPFGRHDGHRIRTIPSHNLPAFQKRRQVVLVVSKCQSDKGCQSVKVTKGAKGCQSVKGCQRNPFGTL